MNYDSPYSAPNIDDNVTEHRPEPPRTSSRHLYFASLFVAAACLLQYMLLDVFVVRFQPYPADAHRFDWVFVLFPVVPLVTLLLMQGSGRLQCSLRDLAGCLIAGCLCAVPLITTFGIWFHFAIGGKL